MTRFCRLANSFEAIVTSCQGFAWHADQVPDLRSTTHLQTKPLTVTGSFFARLRRRGINQESKHGDFAL
jgi:hypothetical protein